MSALKDLTGQRFGRLVAIGREGSTAKGIATWRCLCDCGKEVVVKGTYLRFGEAKSCGCWKGEVGRKRLTTHGRSGTRLWSVWCSMKDRCYNSRNKSYNRYGARGITVCDEWRNDFQAFYEWSMANGYNENASFGQCTIDRIENNKGYSPKNCRWVDMKTQRHNRSDMKE